MSGKDKGEKRMSSESKTKNLESASCGKPGKK